jgi:hypothetical protein
MVGLDAAACADAPELLIEPDREELASHARDLKA